MPQLLERFHVMIEHHTPRPLDLHRLHPSYLVAEKACPRSGHVYYFLNRLDLSLPAEQMQELTRKNDIDLAAQIPQRRLGIKNVRLDEARFHRFAVPKQIEPNVPQLGMQVGCIHVLRRRPVGRQSPQILAEGAAEIQDRGGVPDPCEDGWIVGESGYAGEEEQPFADARILA